jgi:hypothetical protein
MHFKNYIVTGTPEELKRIQEEYIMLGRYTFFRGGDLVVSPWPKPKPKKQDDDNKEKRQRVKN